MEKINTYKSDLKYYHFACCLFLAPFDPFHLGNHRSSLFEKQAGNYIRNKNNKKLSIIKILNKKTKIKGLDPF